MIKNSNGFSLVSVLVSAGIAGGVALVVMQLWDNLKGVETRSTGIMDAREILSEVRVILENEKNCKLSLRASDGSALTFKKTAIDEPEKDPGLPLELWIGNADGTLRSAKKFFDGAVLGKTKVNSIRLFMNNGTGADYGLGSKSDLGIIKVNYSFVSQPSKNLIRDFLINVDFLTDASGQSTIMGCQRSGIKSLCESLNMDYNPETQRCVTPSEACDDWKILAPEGSWSGWKEQACTRIDGGYVQSIIFGQSKVGINDYNSMKIKCCYNKKYELSTCSTVEMAGTTWWSGVVSGSCGEKPRGFIRKIEFYQGVVETKDTNGMRLQCCYPN